VRQDDSGEEIGRRETLRISTEDPNDQARWPIHGGWNRCRVGDPDEISTPTRTKRCFAVLVTEPLPSGSSCWERVA